MKPLVFLALFLFAMSKTAGANQSMIFKNVSNGGNCAGCGWTMAEGEITSETPNRFREFIKLDEFSGKYVRINSNGGDLAAALELGRLFRKRKSTLEVGKTVPMADTEDWFEGEAGRCLSACAYAFLGGTTREVPDKSELGFHQFFDGDILSNIAEKAFTGAERLQDQYVVGVLINYLIEMGISTELYPLVAATPPGNMKLLGKSEALGLRVDNSDNPTSGWKFVPFGKGLVAEIGNSTSRRRVRLYCTGSGSHHLAFFIPNSSSDGKEAGWEPEKFFAGRYNNLTLTVKKNVWPTKFNLFTYSKDKSELIFVFDMSRKAASSIASNDELRIWPSKDVPRADTYFLTELSVAGIGGDLRIPKLALKNCI